MTTKHTPGPWEIDGEYVQPAGQTSVAVCDVMVMDEGGSKGWYRGPITQANARLIAASPDLLAQAEKHLAWLSKLTDWAGADDPDLDGLRVAIAKARGAQ
jgi:hypothetical protein